MQKLSANQCLSTEPVVNKQSASISLSISEASLFPLLAPQNLKRVIHRLKDKQLQLISLPTSTRFGGNMRLSDQGTQTRSQPPHHTPSSGHLTATFLHPRSPQTRRASTFITDVENHLHGISGRQRTASYSFFLIPDTDKEGCGGMRFFERKLPRHLSVSRIVLRPRCLLFSPYFPPQTAVCTAEWKITGFGLHRGRRRDEEEEGGRKGGVR